MSERGRTIIVTAQANVAQRSDMPGKWWAVLRVRAGYDLDDMDEALAARGPFDTRAEAEEAADSVEESDIRELLGLGPNVPGVSRKGVGVIERAELELTVDALRVELETGKAPEEVS